MKGLAWKELREWGPLSAGLLIGLCIAWLLVGNPVGILLAPHEEPALMVLTTACLFGVALGYGQLSAERSRGTLPYVVHREGGRQALLRGKLSVGIGLALGVAMLPPLVFFVQQSLGTMAPVLQPARALELALAGLAVLPAYASGVFIALVAPSVFLALSLAAIAVAGCILYSLWLPLPIFQMSPWAVPLFALGEVALAGAVLALAWQFFERAHDRDAVLPFRLQAGAAGFALLLFVVPSWWGYGTAIRTGQQSLFNGYPVLVRYTDGHYAPMERSEFHARVNSDQPGRSTLTLPDGTVGTEPDPALAYNPSAPVEMPASLRKGFMFRERGTLKDFGRWLPLFVGRFASLGGQYLDKDGQTVQPSPREPDPGLADETYFDVEAGVVRQFKDLPRAEAGSNVAKALAANPRQIVLRRTDGTPFSRATIVVMDEMQAPLLIDLEDHTAWMLDFAAAGTRLAQMSLPDDDLLIDVEPTQQWNADGWSSYSQSQAVLVGAKGRYQWTTTGFKPAGSPATRPWWLRHCRGEVGETSLTELTVRLRNLDEQGNVGPQSEIAFVQRYEPRTLGEQTRAALMRAGIQCGPPVLSAQRLFAGSGEPLTLGLMPRVLLVPKDSAGVHLLHVLLGLALGALTWVRVGRRGGTSAERMLWSVFVACFGVLALGFLGFLAPRPQRERVRPAAEARVVRPASTLAST